MHGRRRNIRRCYTFVDTSTSLIRSSCPLRKSRFALPHTHSAIWSSSSTLARHCKHRARPGISIISKVAPASGVSAGKDFICEFAGAPRGTSRTIIIYTVATGLTAEGTIPMNPADAAPFGIALLGLLLVMRHATDPDHVIAVTTILSRERRLMTAARIGVVWGLGHTLTVLLMGAAIIVFKIAIPARLGLAMEFAVAVVLILLGIGAATSLMRKFAAWMRGTSSDREDLIVHAHPHTHGDTAHSHSHVHVGADDRIHHDHRIAADKMPAFGSRSPLL